MDKVLHLIKMSEIIYFRTDYQIANIPILFMMNISVKNRFILTKTNTINLEKKS